MHAFTQSAAVCELELLSEVVLGRVERKVGGHTVLKSLHGLVPVSTPEHESCLFVGRELRVILLARETFLLPLDRLHGELLNVLVQHRSVLQADGRLGLVVDSLHQARQGLLFEHLLPTHSSCSLEVVECKLLFYAVLAQFLAILSRKLLLKAPSLENALQQLTWTARRRNLSVELGHHADVGLGRDTSEFFVKVDIRDVAAAYLALAVPV